MTYRILLDSYLSTLISWVNWTRVPYDRFYTLSGSVRRLRAVKNDGIAVMN
jgi:hypothetical protein